MRARAEVVIDSRDRESIIVHEIPYQVNKAQLLERIGELVREKTIEGISDIRDESDRTGMRVVVEVKRDCPVTLFSTSSIVTQGCRPVSRSTCWR